MKNNLYIATLLSLLSGSIASTEANTSHDTLQASNNYMYNPNYYNCNHNSTGKASLYPSLDNYPISLYNEHNYSFQPSAPLGSLLEVEDYSESNNIPEINPELLSHSSINSPIILKSSLNAFKYPLSFFRSSSFRFNKKTLINTDTIATKVIDSCLGSLKEIKNKKQNSSSLLTNNTSSSNDANALKKEEAANLLLILGSGITKLGIKTLFFINNYCKIIN